PPQRKILMTDLCEDCRGPVRLVGLASARKTSASDKWAVPKLSIPILRKLRRVTRSHSRLFCPKMLSMHSAPLLWGGRSWHCCQRVGKERITAPGGFYSKLYAKV